MKVWDCFSSPEILKLKEQCELERCRGAAPNRLQCRTTDSTNPFETSMDRQPRSLPTRRYISMRCYITNSYIGKSVHLLLGQTSCVCVCIYIYIPYFPAHKTHFFPEKCNLNSTCVLCAEGIISKLINTRTSIIHLYREIVKSASKSSDLASLLVNGLLSYLGIYPNVYIASRDSRYLHYCSSKV